MNSKTKLLLLCALMVLGLNGVLSSLLTASATNALGNVSSLLLPILPRSSGLTPTSDQVGARIPMIQGWGGATLDEASSGQMQSTLSRLNQSGYNGVRVGFGASITPCSSGELGSWSTDWFNQTMQIAAKYNMWVILDYHSYRDLVDGCQTQWLSFWKGVLLANWGYSRIVWEPINEPAGSVSVLSLAYQAWITQARGLGDAHWIAIENTISNNGCNFDPLSIVNCYPLITDPMNETFLSIHPYFFYNIWQGGGYGNCGPTTNTWGNSTAECVASIYNQGMLQASSTYHMPILDTEGGAVYYSCNNVCATPPDAVGTDDASYSITTLHFIQYLTSKMQSEKMGWLWWEAGEGSCCGALDTWGNLLRFQPLTTQAPTHLVAIVDSELSFNVNASELSSPSHGLALACVSCPAGANFPRVSGLGLVIGVFTWTPTGAQGGISYDITFAATDGGQNSNATTVITVQQRTIPSNGLLPMDSPIAWLVVAATAGFAILTAVTLYRRKNSA